MKRETITLTNPGDHWHYLPGDRVKTDNAGGVGAVRVVTVVEPGCIVLRDTTTWERIRWSAGAPLRWLRRAWRSLTSRRTGA